jgi:hypothetical protein
MQLGKLSMRLADKSICVLINCHKSERNEFYCESCSGTDINFYRTFPAYSHYKIFARVLTGSYHANFLDVPRQETQNQIMLRKIYAILVHVMLDGSSIILSSAMQ